MKSDRRELERPVGTKAAVRRKVVKAPRRKEAIDTRVVSQACGLEGTVAVERPRITVLPVWDLGVSLVVGRTIGMMAEQQDKCPVG